MRKIKDEKGNIETKRKKYALMLVWACFSTYFLAMATKNTYTAEMIALQDVFNKTKPQISLAMTYFFITYAIMQVALSTFMTKINLRLYLTVTVAISAIFTLLLGISPTIEFVYVVCALNGIVQAGIYSGCMSMLGKYLPPEMLNFANKIMNFAASAYGILSYGTSAFFVNLGLWNYPFFLMGALSLASAFFLLYSINKAKEYECCKMSSVSTSNVKEIKEIEFMTFSNKTQKVSWLLIVFVIILFSNTMGFMIMNWAPKLLYDVFGLSQSYSILITLVVSLFSALCAIWVVNICAKRENLIKISAIFFFVSVLIGVVMIFLYDLNIVLSIVLLLLSLVFATGARAVFGGIMAFRMRKQIDPGIYLSSTNAIASVCAGVAPVMAGAIIEAFTGHTGYSVLFIVFSIVGVALLITLALFSMWLNKNKKKAFIKGEI